MRNWAMIAPLLGLAGCSIGADLPVAERGAETLHKQLNDGKCADIRKTAAPEFRQMSTDETWRSMCNQLDHGLGKVELSKQIGWQDQMVNSDHRISVVYETRFENGPGREEFIFRIQDGRAILLGYHVNSPVFGEKPDNATEPANAAATA